MKSNSMPSNLTGPRVNRRDLILGLGSGALLCAASKTLAGDLYTKKGLLAEQLTRTAWVEEGPFYPYHRLPLDTDNDLIIINDAITPAVGDITHLGGRLLDSRGDPIRNARIEIWQVDSTATYLAERGARTDRFDAHFQGFGRFLTGSTGEYYFRTIKPVAYRGRPAPHIHFKVYVKGMRPFTTQLFIKGYPGNLQDGVYNRSGNAAEMASVTVDYVPLKSSRIGELAANFDIVLGYTPEA